MYVIRYRTRSLAALLVAIGLWGCSSATRVGEDAGDSDAARDGGRRDAGEIDTGPADAGPDSPWRDPDGDMEGVEELVEVGHLSTELATDLFVASGHAYLTDRYEGLVVIDVSDVTAPRVVGRLAAPGANAVQVSAGHAFVARGWADAPVQAPYGVLVADVREPARPVEVSFHPTPAEPLALVVRQPHAYVAARLEGLRILEVGDPARVEDRGFWILTGQARELDVEVDGDLAYVAASDNLLHIVDVSDPRRPRGVSTVNIPAPPRDVAVARGLACVAAGAAGVRIVDASDPADPRHVGSFTVARGGFERVAVRETALFVAGEIESRSWLLVLDLSDPAAPVLVARRRLASVSSVAGIAVDDRYVYVADIGRGLVIFEQP